jgi:hypothetical protein
MPTSKKAKIEIITDEKTITFYVARENTSLDCDGIIEVFVTEDLKNQIQNLTNGFFSICFDGQILHGITAQAQI